MTPVPCQHWTPSETPGASRCAVGKAGGRPSHDWCRAICLRVSALCETAPPPLVQVRVKDLRLTEGPKRWAALHRRALAWDGTNPETEMNFIRKLADGLGLCSCKRDWAALLVEIPPDLTSAEGYFAWSYHMHRCVSEKLKKDCPTLDQARSLWAADAP